MKRSFSLSRSFSLASPHPASLFTTVLNGDVCLMGSMSLCVWSLLQHVPGHGHLAEIKSL